MTETELVSHDIDSSRSVEEYAESIEAWRNPITRRDYFELLEENDFLDLLQRTASLVRGGTSNEQQHFDGKSVSLMTSPVPDQREKETLLRQTWQSAQLILKDRSLEDRDALELAALTIAGGVVLTHPFADGNGRTSRAISFLVARGNEEKGELGKILTETGGGGNWYMTPNVRILFPRDKPNHHQYHIDMGDFFAGEGEDAYGGEIVEAYQEQVVLNEFIHTADKETSELIAPFLEQAEEDSSTLVDGQALVESLAHSPRAMEYRHKLNELMRRKRTSLVTRFLEVMKSSEEVDINGIFRAFIVDKSRRSRMTKKALGALDQEGTLPLREQVRGLHRAVSLIYDKDKTNTGERGA